jgi:hypothetical protein
MNAASGIFPLSERPLDARSEELHINPLNAELNPICKSQLAELLFFWGGGGHLNFAHDFQKTGIYGELSGINL